jgi:hypothetical protein
MPRCCICAEEADEWYHDQWMCLSCIVDGDFDEDTEEGRA